MALSFTPQTLLLNGGIILVLISAIFGGIIYQQFSRDCNFNKESDSCTYVDPLRGGIILFSFIGMVLILVGFAMSIVKGLNESD